VRDAAADAGAVAHRVDLDTQPWPLSSLAGSVPEVEAISLRDGNGDDAVA
jgi:hypothetical protein